MATNWTLEETLAVLYLYDRMLQLDRDGKLGPAKSRGQTSKAELVRAFIADKAPGRNKQSVELKLMNVSYCRQEAGMDVLRGYKPMSNCSSDLLSLFNVERRKR